MHNDLNKRKAEFYAPFQEVMPGVFWKVLLEVTVDRSKKRVPGRWTDQWIQPAGSVVLEAVWLRIKSAGEMDPEDWYCVDKWNPEDERNPHGPANRSAGELASGIRSRSINNRLVGRAGDRQESTPRGLRAFTEKQGGTVVGQPQGAMCPLTQPLRLPRRAKYHITTMQVQELSQHKMCP